jgi:PKD repeat protein
MAGTYAAACSFYATLFRKDPTAITFNSNLSTKDAANIRIATKLMVYDSLKNWHIGEYDPLANFTYSISNGNQVDFTNSSFNATNFNWNFGDGGTSISNNPTHTYLIKGTYKVQLISNKCDIYDTTFQTIKITMPLGVDETTLTNDLNIYPNPVSTILNLQYSLSNKATYKILGVVGQEIQSGIINNIEKQINVSLLSEGIYLLQLYENNEPLGQQKFVKITK